MQRPCKIEGTVGCLPARQHRVVSGKVFFNFFFYLPQNFFFLNHATNKKNLVILILTLSFLTSILLFKRNSVFTHHLNSYIVYILPERGFRISVFGIKLTVQYRWWWEDVFGGPLFCFIFLLCLGSTTLVVGFPGESSKALHRSFARCNWL